MKKLILIVCLAFCLIESKGQVDIGSQTGKVYSFFSSYLDSATNIVLRFDLTGTPVNVSGERIICDSASRVSEHIIWVDDYNGNNTTLKLSTNNGLEFFSNIGIIMHQLPTGCTGRPSKSLYKDSNNFLKICP